MSKQVVQPRIRGFISLTAHPDGCAANVREQVAAIRAAGLQGHIGVALVIGSSTGYGLSSALAATFGYGAKTLGVCFEKEPADDKTGTAGWYNVAEARRLAAAEGLTYETINADAFSDEAKEQVVEALRRIGPVDMLVYSLAAPRRREPDGTVWTSALKPIGAPYQGRAFDLRSEAVVDTALDVATDEEIEATIKVMGGEDWRHWVYQLRGEGLLAPGARTVAYSYIGPEVTAPIYRRGTIGAAKEHLERTGVQLHETLSQAGDGGGAWVSVNKSVVTQASAAIPAVPLYLSAVYKVMKAQGLHEGTTEQIVRLFRDHIGPGRTPTLDDARRIRLDDLEMSAEVQAAVERVWDTITTENLAETTDYAGYKADFHRLFGFGVVGVDYDAPTEVMRSIS
ncbi:MAG: trans-2-enoyl-CoA reductase family protein [Chloroflexi bacterium]|nr:trans-2-enoyl-CoA reductase family protein [Chloroflexota bacterium]MDA1240512.1 trans-2-enoyl-CoA reductase family protein [Chloroflexota bacterium]MQC19151.1 trans-2-enoyl-CoA reductase family protein [Chloroflexota bacterium]